MNEKNIYIVRCGEVALKGMNKPYFERVLSRELEVFSIRMKIRNQSGMTDL